MTRSIPPEITDTLFDAVIVGAGINGSGIARDAAMRGLSVLLLDKGDLAGGTTAWSTRLIHGGLRYLEHGEIGLVRESLRERENLLRVAPHLVRPLRLLVPIYEDGRRGKLTIRAGMLAYDALSFDKSLPPHRMLSRAETLKFAPGLRAEGLRGAGVYYDAQVEFPERLVVENVLSARMYGAQAVTYARVEKFLFEGRAIRGVEFRDLLGGGVSQARARLVVNASGPWVDRVLQQSFGEHDSDAPRQLIGGTKGSHVIVERFEGAPPDALYAEAGADARPFFVIPWNGKVLIGTTDTRFDEDPDRAVAVESEIDYLIRETNRLLPTANLTRASVIYTYSGVRPLPHVSAPSEAGITRRHFVHDHAPASPELISVVGGKLTTYRSLAEQTVILLFKKLKRPAPPCQTSQTPLPGAETEDYDAFRERFTANSELPESVRERLLRIYGVRATEVERIASEAPELGEIFCEETEAVGAEVVMSFRHESAETLADCLLRRTMVGLARADTGVGVAEAAARVAQKFLGWDAARAAREVAAYREHVARFHPRGPADE